MIHRIKSRRGSLVASLQLTAFLGACATLDGVTTTLVTDKCVEHVIAGRGAPAVVFENGLGGLYMQLHARRYPHEVAGLVPVASTHPEQMKGAGAREN